LSAREQLRRLLWLVPAAGRPDGVSLAEAASELGVTQARIQADLNALTEREFYQPAGTAERLEIEIDGDRLYIRSTGQFSRPPRLTPRELFCLALGLRLIPDAPDGLLERVESALAFGGRKGAGDGSGHGAGHGSGHGSGHGPALAREAVDADVVGASWSMDDVLVTLRTAWQERLAVAFSYLKPGAPAPELRTLRVYGLVSAEGRWYAVGTDPEAAGGGEGGARADTGGDRTGDAVRRFRADRMLSVRLLEDQPFDPDPDFELSRVLDHNRVLSVDAPEEAAVRYAPEVAPWVREQFPGGEDEEDGGYRVRHIVGDTGWLVRQVLSYGEAARVVGPPEMVAAVRDVVRGMMAEGAQGPT
jgi:proteasome accessory factor C